MSGITATTIERTSSMPRTVILLAELYTGRVLRWTILTEGHDWAYTQNQALEAAVAALGGGDIEPEDEGLPPLELDDLDKRIILGGITWWVHHG